jgi:hypothetical protein
VLAQTAAIPWFSWCPWVVLRGEFLPSRAVTETKEINLIFHMKMITYFSFFAQKSPVSPKLITNFGVFFVFLLIFLSRQTFALWGDYGKYFRI